MTAPAWGPVVPPISDAAGNDGIIGVTCEFCATYRAFDPDDFGDPQ
jgi:hypothetical protein